MTYVHTWVDTIMIQLFTIVYGAFVVTLLEAASHYGRRSRGQRLPPIILQETKNSVARPFTLEGKNQKATALRKCLYGNNFWPRQQTLEGSLGHTWMETWSFLLVHIRFTPSEGPKGFVNCFFFERNRNMKVGPSSRTTEKPIFHGPTSWCKPALRVTSHTSQEPWPWNCESPKDSVQRPSQGTFEIM